MLTRAAVRAALVFDKDLSTRLYCRWGDIQPYDGLFFGKSFFMIDHYHLLRGLTG